MAQQQALARITPLQRAAVAPAPRAEGDRAQGPSSRDLNSRQKAAVIVHYLLSEGANIPLAQLPETLQASLTEQMGAMRLVDRETLQKVLEEFTAELSSVGLTFPGGIEGALSAMDGHISHSAASRLRRLAGMASKADPWERLVLLPPETLQPLIESEATEVAAVILSKLSAQKAADLLARFPTEKAQRIAFALSQTGNTDPETVRRIGLALLSQIESRPARAFERGPVERVGAILDSSPAATRDALLRGLEAEDRGFADQVKRAIFTWQHIPERIAAADVPNLVRALERDLLVVALKYTEAKDPGVAQFLYAALPNRLAQSLRDDVAERRAIKESEGEEAYRQIIDTIRGLEKSGDLALQHREAEITPP